MVSMWVVSFAIFEIVNGIRLENAFAQIGLQDTSNCTWSNFTECALETKTRCSRYRTLDVLPLESQAVDLPGKVPCSGQAGQRETESCTDGLCPSWVVGNWTDCSNTCNQTLAPWVGIQSRDVTCEDVSGVFYTNEVCVKLYGVALEPSTEQPCECSHQVPSPDPYGVTSSAVSL